MRHITSRFAGFSRGMGRVQTWLRPVAALSVLLMGAAVHSATITAADAPAFTNALNSAALGDTIILNAGTTYTGSFTLPNKTTGSGYITIQSSALASLPAAGTRVTPANAANMPKVVSSGLNAPAIRAATSAHHYRMIGLEIIGPANNSALTQLVELGTSGTAQDTLAEVPNNIHIERCIVRANSTTQTLRRGIALNSASTDILDSHVAGCKEVGADSQAVGGWNGPGPYNIINNYLEGAGENVMFGGSDPSIPNLVPSDIQFKRNHCFKPLTWKIGDPSYAGTPWTVKNIFELKNARRVVIDGNLFEHNWPHGQSGVGILFTVRNQDGNAPWCTIEDVDFTNNIVRKTGSAFNLLGIDNNYPSQQLKRLKIENNLIYDVGGSIWGGGGILYLMLERTDTVTINHNTGFHTGNIISVDGPPHSNFVCTNNMQAHNDYGVIGSGQAVGNGSLNFFYSSPKTFTKNVLMGGPASLYNQYAGNFFPTSWSGVLVNQASPGANFAGWKVVTGSAYDNAGTDGKDIGCDIDVVNTATAGCISGVWSGGGGGGTTTVVLKNGVSGYSGSTSFETQGEFPTTHVGPSQYVHHVNTFSGTSIYSLRSFYKFDVSQAASTIPANAVITSASLKFKVEYSGGSTDAGIKLHRMAPVGGAFNVNYATATRNSYNGSSNWTGGQNAAGNVADSNNDYLDTPDSTATLPAEGATGTITFDVTSSVQAWVNGTANNGWIIMPNARVVYLGTPADLHGSADFPELTVTYQNAGPPPSTTKVLKNGVNGYTGNTSFEVKGEFPTTHFGSSDYSHHVNIFAGANFYCLRSFYKFDVSQAATGIPASAVVDSATLKIKIEYSGGSTDAGIKIHRVSPVGGAFTVNYATATRNSYNGSSNWTGGQNAAGDVANSNNDFLDTPDSTATLPAEGAQGFITFDVKSSVQAWVNGTANNGWLILPNARVVYMGTPADLHGSADYPELTITYH